jgi:hypothetical protein
MSLTLNGWPPLASHVVALLTGVSLANLAAQEQFREIGSFLPRKGDLLALQVEKTQIKIPQDDFPQDQEKKLEKVPNGAKEMGGSRFLVRAGAHDHDDCLVSTKPLEIREVDSERVVIAAQKGQTGVILSLVEIFTTNDPVKIYLNRPKKPLCQPKNLVRYDN